ncbi:lanthionine synthetase LanC family protein [Fodinicola acaciae]|uniref:class III lanthionine synthetase LanKC N-terminal domain-containing protein n=1 Tax=Fodinicola acaciae TaxID=2681555 RepID=UPI0013D860E9|nr:lanthionine synthetase LanC family protein [Fodinicola acaciae]
MTSEDVELVVRSLVAGHGRQVRASSLWLQVSGADPDEVRPHGWKLHVSARAADFAAVVTEVVPLLLDAGCAFKLARSVEVLSQLNDGNPTPALVGKAFTVYPAEPLFRPLAEKLAGVLGGRPAPRVLSDRQVAADAPVYYRYGPFASNLSAEPDGKVISAIVGPHGDRFDGTAELTYRQPSWVTDPFGADPAPPDEPVILGRRYRPAKGIFQSPRGNVYTAFDEWTGEKVVVKRARAYVGETDAGYDTRLRLRNERYVLTALAGIAGVPRCLDHFRHGDDEFLVTSFGGKFNLGEDIGRRGRYRPSTVDRRSLDSLACRLGGIIAAVHDRGFVSRDVSPSNVVVDDETYDVTLIDFGICHHGDVRMPGGTPGIAPARQFAGEPAHPADDCHALGMVLLQAATGAPAATGGADPAAPRRHALEMIDRIYGTDLPPAIAYVVGLLSDDPDEAVATLRAIVEKKPPPVEPVACAPTYAPDLLDRTRENVLAAIDARLAEPDGFVEPNVYRGVSGVGLELLHHLDKPGVAEMVRRLQDYCAQSATRLDLPPGLLLGATGVRIFLEQARICGSDGPVLPAETAGWRPKGDEITIGAAGIGLGHLVLDRLAPHPDHERVVRESVERVTRHLDPESAFAPEQVSEESGMDTTTGFAHGLSGVIALLLAVRDTALWSESLENQLARRLELVRARTTRLIEVSAMATAVPLSVSWCRGLAGIGRTLWLAGHKLADRELVELAVAAGSACADWVPYLANRGQCCGISGVGEFFLDLAEENERFGAAAESAATQLVVRGLADPPANVKVTRLGEQDGVAWSGGISGQLAFLRRLRDRGTGNPMGPFPAP